MGITRDKSTNWNFMKIPKDVVKPHYVVKLEHVLGLTVTSNSALDCDSKTGIIAYPAGCTIVFLSPYREKQSHLLNDSRKSVTCLTYSPDGRYLATGEYGHQPSIRIWDLSDHSKCCEFTDHKCGINCLAFSPNQKYLVSVGSQHDMIINVWDWRTRVKIGANKVSTKIKAVAFCESGDYFVTVGNRHVKFWYIQQSKQSLNKDQPGLIGRAAILGEQQNNDFVDVVCGRGNFQDMTYVIARSGILCEFNGRRLLDRWVNVKTSMAFCITAGEEYLFIGCTESIVRCFNVSTLAFVTTLPRTHYLGVDVAKALNITHTAAHPKDARYPDTIAIAYDDVHKKLTCVYNDHSLYVWDIHDIRKVGKSNSYLYHCACIWGVETYPDSEENIMPSGSFITCSSDDTIRFWNMDKQKSDYDTDHAYQSNIYSNELLKIIYIDPELQYIKNTDIGLTEKTETVSYDDRNGVRSMGISGDGQQLATGDRSGNIRVYGLKNVEEICKIEAHDAEILCLEYTPPIPNSSKRLLLSASRDRLIHVFDASDYYKFVETLDDHSSSITAIRFIDVNGQLQLVSCSADKSIIFRRYQNGKNGHFVRDRLLTGKSTLYDMAIDCTQKYVLTACQDRHIRVYNVNNGKQCKNFKGSMGEEGSVIKVALDNSGRYLATSCTDKTLCIFDYYSGECIACICGHSELVTGLRFSNDCERLISASGDGCIFIWRLPRDMVVTMQTRIAQQRARSASSKLGYETSDDHMNEMNNVTTTHLKQEIRKEVSNGMRFNDGQLPLWVTKSVHEESSLVSESNTRKMMPKGRWAQRLTPFSQDGILNIPSSGRESDGSKEDSSVDSGTETSRPEDRHEKLIIPQKMLRSPPKFITVDDSSDRRTMSANITDLQDIHRTRQHTDDSSLGSFKNEDVESIEHDGDVEDYSEVESTENGSNNKVIYYEMVDDALSEFKVNAIDADELRKSQRKIKHNKLIKKNPTLSLDVTSCYSVSGSQESDDDDDDEGSTPSADTSEKTNSLTLSSVDAFVQREKYLKGTYESLSGLEMDMKHAVEFQDKKSTISSQHHNYSSEYRNQKIIQATMQTRNDKEASRKRQELKSRLEDIRGKLECAGTSLKSSQSTMDLRRNGSYFVPQSSRRNSVVSPVLNDYQQGTLSRSSYHNNINHNNNAKVCINSRNYWNSMNTFPKPYHRSNGYLTHASNYNNTETNDFGRPNVLYVGSRLKNAIFSLPQSPVCEQEFASMGCFKPNVVRYPYVDVRERVDEDCYSSDSLDEDGNDAYNATTTATISAKTRRRRRCVSEYQLSDAYRTVESANSRHSYWNAAARVDMSRSHSEENILNDNNDDDDDDDCSFRDNSDRHSSASFFLRKRKSFNSNETIATDESEYQFLFSNREAFRSTESVLTDASDSNLNSQSDDANLAEETTWSQTVAKTPVLRTRSLQEARGSGGELTNTYMTQREEKIAAPTLSTLTPKPKNESFFIPVDDGGGSLKSPEQVKELFLRKISSRSKKCEKVETTRTRTTTTTNKSLEHPLIAHKPPKPQKRGAASSVSVGKKSDERRTRANDDRKRNDLNEKYGTFTKSKANLGKNLLKNHLIEKPTAKITNVTAAAEAAAAANDQLNFRVWNKNAKNEALKRAATITKRDVNKPTMVKTTTTTTTTKTRVSNEDRCALANARTDACTAKRYSLPDTSMGGKSSAASDSEMGIRRSCSLSDLSTSGVFTSSSNQKKHSDKYAYKHKDGPIHSSTPFNSPMSRSSSEVTLMPPPSIHYRRNARAGGNGEMNNNSSQRVMRPTIASQNKTKSSASGKTNSNTMRRRSIATVSYVNDGNMEDSSSEDNKSDRPNKATFSDKPFLKGSKFMERSCSERDLSALNHSSKKRSQYLNEARSEMHLFSSQIPDVTNAPLSRELLNAVVEQFKKTADNIIRVHDRIAVENINDAEKKLLLNSLRNTIGQVQSSLHHKLDSESSASVVAHDESGDGLTSLPHKDNMVSMIQQYSDVLVSMVQQKFEKKPT